jgi:hypothetical protein
MPRGGFRPGAGRPKGAKDKNPSQSKAKEMDAATQQRDPLKYVLDVMSDPYVDEARRDRMAAIALPFCHPKKGEGAGKKNEQKKKAEDALNGKFKPRPAPLKVVK